MSDTTKLRRFRFSLKTLRIIMAIVAVIIGAYNFGYQKGYSTAKQESQADYVIYPTQRADRLVAAINRGDVHPYDVVEQPQTPLLGNPQGLKITGRKTAVAELALRTWSDT